MAPPVPRFTIAAWYVSEPSPKLSYPLCILGLWTTHDFSTEFSSSNLPSTHRIEHFLHS
jgi:hypothetical protein